MNGKQLFDKHTEDRSTAYSKTLEKAFDMYGSAVYILLEQAEAENKKVVLVGKKANITVK